ncbi:WGR domain-containing protein [Cystobacter fuscus]
MPLYEFKEGSSSKFWEITLSGNSFTTRWGKIGTKGQEKTQNFSNAVEAKREHDKLIAEKTKKGYELAEGQDAPAEDGEGDDSSNLAKRNPELEAAIEKDPDNVEGYLVYGDWLQSQGDPRGELIALQCAAHQASGEEATNLKRQASALVRKYKKYLLGALADKADNEVDVGWRFGFIQSARLARGDFDSEFDAADAVKHLLALPSARFLRELTFGMADFEENSYSEAIEALKGTTCPTLETLFIGDFEYPDETEISWTHLQDISPVYKAFPRLRSLKVRGGELEMGEVNLPELREFTVETGGLPLAAVKSIVKANWPKLERLEVWFGSENYGAGGGVDDIQPLLEGKGVPALKHLGLRNAEFTNELCKALPRAKILPQLESLDLSMGTMTKEGAEALVANAAAFKHLKRLDVTENLLSDEAQKQVAKLGEYVAHGNQRDDYDEDDDYRYVAVGE